MVKVRFPRSHRVKESADATVTSNVELYEYKFQKLTLFRPLRFGRAMMKLLADVPAAESQEAGFDSDAHAKYKRKLSTAKRVGGLMISSLSDVPVGMYTVKTRKTSNSKLSIERFTCRWNLVASVASMREGGGDKEISMKQHLLDKLRDYRATIHNYRTGERDSGSRLVTGLIRKDLLPSELTLQQAASSIFTGMVQIGMRANAEKLKVARVDVPPTAHIAAAENLVDLKVHGFEYINDEPTTIEGNTYLSSNYELELPAA